MRAIRPRLIESFEPVVDKDALERFFALNPSSMNELARSIRPSMARHYWTLLDQFDAVLADAQEEAKAVRAFGERYVGVMVQPYLGLISKALDEIPEVARWATRLEEEGQRLERLLRSRPGRPAGRERRIIQQARCHHAMSEFVRHRSTLAERVSELLIVEFQRRVEHLKGEEGDELARSLLRTLPEGAWQNPSDEHVSALRLALTDTDPEGSPEWEREMRTGSEPFLTRWLPRRIRHHLDGFSDPDSTSRRGRVLSYKEEMRPWVSDPVELADENKIRLKLEVGLGLLARIELPSRQADLAEAMSKGITPRGWATSRGLHPETGARTLRRLRERARRRAAKD